MKFKIRYVLDNPVWQTYSDMDMEAANIKSAKSKAEKKINRLCKVGECYRILDIEKV